MDLPSSLEGEQAVLGSILLDPSKLSLIQDSLKATDFYLDAHAHIYEACTDIVAEGRSLDMVTLIEKLSSRLPHTAGFSNLLESCGGLVYLHTIMEAPSCASLATEYAEMVLQASLRRELMDECIRYHSLLKTDSGSLKAILSENGTSHFAERIQNRLMQSRKEMFQFKTVGQILADLPEMPPFLISGLLPANNFFLLSGKPKHGKSVLALEIADCVVTGRDFLGVYAINNPGPVLYLSMENSVWTDANRLIGRGIKANDPRQIYLSNKRYALGDQATLKTLTRAVKPLGLRLIIIDTATEALGVRDWNDRSEVTTKMAPLRDFARETCTVLLVAHNRKAEGDGGTEIAGSNGVAGAVDGWFSSQSKEELDNGNYRVRYSVEGRDVRGEFIVEVENDTYKCTAVSKQDIADKKREGEKELKYTAVESILLSQQPATVKTIATTLAWSQTNTWSIIGEMIRSGRIVDTGEVEKGAKGRPAPLYRLPEETASEQPAEAITNHALGAFFGEEQIEDPYAEE